MTYRIPSQWRAPWLIGAAILTLGLGRAASAQEITVDPTNANAVYTAGQAWGGMATNPVINAGGVISYYYNAGWIEIPFHVDTAGLYDAAFTVYTPQNNLRAQFDVRPAGTDTHYVTPDFDVPNTGDWGNPITFTVSGIPLWQSGDFIFRVYNTTLLHNNTAADRKPGYQIDPDAPQGTDGTRYTGFNWGPIVLTRTGDVPGLGTVSGTVKSADMGNIAVAGAFVMASTGDSVPEPGPFWQKGFWTNTGADGSFSLPAMAGSVNVQAGQPSMYAISGSPVVQATVTAGQTAAANLDLPSRFAKTPEGKATVEVQSEYFIGKDPDAFSTNPGAYNASPVVIQGVVPALNGFFAGYMDIGNYIDVPVDIPAGQGGEYTVTDRYFNGYWDGVSYRDAITRFTVLNSTADNYAQVTEPNSAPNDEFGNRLPPAEGYNNAALATPDKPITLQAGHNVIRLSAQGDGAVNSASAWDAFTLTQVSVPVPAGSAIRALKIAAGLAAADSADFAAQNVVTTGTSASQVDLFDVIALAKEGKL